WDFVEKVFRAWTKREKKSWRNDVSRLKPIVAHFKDKKMGEITRRDVEHFKQVRRNSLSARKRPLSPASVDSELPLLSRLFTVAVEHELLESIPCRGVKLCGVSNIVPKFLSDEDEAKLLPVLTGARAHLLDILQIDTHTGMRRTELLSLHRSQIDLSRNTIVVLHTKNGKQRVIPIHSNIRPVLERRCEQAG